MTIKPCPFCACEDLEYWAGPDQQGGYQRPEIVCNHCGIGFICGTFTWGFTQEEMQKMVVEKWNRRAPLDKLNN